MSLGTVYQYKSRVVARIRREIEQIDESGKPFDSEELIRWSHERSSVIAGRLKSFLDDDLPEREQVRVERSPGIVCGLSAQPSSGWPPEAGSGASCGSSRRSSVSQPIHGGSVPGTAVFGAPGRSERATAAITRSTSSQARTSPGRWAGWARTK